LEISLKEYAVKHRNYLLLIAQNGWYGIDCGNQILPKLSKDFRNN
jgi:hypothetical protein